MIVKIMHVDGYVKLKPSCKAMRPLLCPEGMLRQLAVEPYTVEGPLKVSWAPEFTQVINYREFLYAVQTVD
jgi:hypothetical protein